MDDLLKIAGPILGVLVGFLLSAYSTRRATDRSALTTFFTVLSEYGAGNATKLHVTIAYQQLGNRDRKRIPLSSLLQASPDTLLEMIAKTSEDRK